MPKIARYVLSKTGRGTKISIVEHAARGGLATVAAVTLPSRWEKGPAVDEALALTHKAQQKRTR